MYQDFYLSKIGLIKVVADDSAIKEISFVDEVEDNNKSNLTKEAIKQLNEYFNGVRSQFDLAVDLNNMNMEILNKILKIGYGKIILLDKFVLENDLDKAEVINFISNNKLLIIVPTHRIIAEINNQFSNIINKELIMLEK